MKVLISPDAFKGTMTAIEAGQAIERGIRKVLPQCETRVLPMADGGGGTLETLAYSLEVKKKSLEVQGPLDKSVWATYLRWKEKTLIEMASAAGLLLLTPEERNPLLTTTYGVGEILAHALDQRSPEIALTLGGSATCDGGIGMAQALGIRFLDHEGKELSGHRPPYYRAIDLGRIRRIDLSCRHPFVAKAEVYGLCDVQNPLTGPRGAARVYSPQKGANKSQVRQLEEALEHLAEVIHGELGVKVDEIAGAGAAGGLGAAIVAFLEGELRPGAPCLAQWLELEKAMEDCHLVVTGEGRVDDQTEEGKTIDTVVDVASRQNRPLVVLAGILTSEGRYLEKKGDVTLYQVTPPRERENPNFKKKAPDFLEETAGQAIRDFIKKDDKR